jgi:hypothetical protein
MQNIFDKMLSNTGTPNFGSHTFRPFFILFAYTHLTKYRNYNNLGVFRDTNCLTGEEFNESYPQI